MKALMDTLSNTYRAVRLLSNPEVGAYLETQFQKKPTEESQEPFGKKNAFYHKHYIVHVLS